MDTHSLLSGFTHTFLVDLSDQGMRLDAFLCRMFPDYSRNFLQQLIKEGCVMLNDKKVHKVAAILKRGDSVTLSIPETKKTIPSFSAQELSTIPAKILFQNDDFACIDKPAGLIVHANHAKMQVPTLVEWLTFMFPGISTIGCLERPGIVHRLDKNTSGVMIIALTNPAFALFSKLFCNRHIHKTYLAVVKGHPEKTGTFTSAIARHQTVRNKMTLHTNGRTAHTNFKVLEYFKDASLVEVTPITGRTHQIRVHFSAAGHPLLADEVYGSRSSLIDRHALHAQKIAFTYKEKSYEFESALPEDFQKLLTALRKT